MTHILFFFNTNYLPGRNIFWGLDWKRRFYLNALKKLWEHLKVQFSAHLTFFAPGLVSPVQDIKKCETKAHKQVEDEDLVSETGSVKSL